MAEVAKSGRPSLSSLLPPQNDSINGLLAGATIAEGDLCYIHSDGTIRPATGAAANAAAKVRGVALGAADVGEAITLYRNVMMRYGAGLTPGADLFLSGTVAGGVADAASTGGTTVVGFVVDATRVYFHIT